MADNRAKRGFRMLTPAYVISQSQGSHKKVSFLVNSPFFWRLSRGGGAKALVDCPL